MHIYLTHMWIYAVNALQNYTPACGELFEQLVIILCLNDNDRQ